MTLRPTILHSKVLDSKTEQRGMAAKAIQEPMHLERTSWQCSAGKSTLSYLANGSLGIAFSSC